MSVRPVGLTLNVAFPAESVTTELPSPFGFTTLRSVFGIITPFSYDTLTVALMI